MYNLNKYIPLFYLQWGREGSSGKISPGWKFAGSQQWLLSRPFFFFSNIFTIVLQELGPELALLVCRTNFLPLSQIRTVCTHLHTGLSPWLQSSWQTANSLLRYKFYWDPYWNLFKCGDISSFRSRHSLTIPQSFCASLSSHWYLYKERSVLQKSEQGNWCLEVESRKFWVYIQCYHSPDHLGPSNPNFWTWGLLICRMRIVMVIIISAGLSGVVKIK